MRGLFNYDGPVMSAMSRIADLICLNILAVICCIPVITAGASLTALHYMTIKMVRNEECYIFKGFFKSFRQNFRQATVIWLILLACILIVWGDFHILNIGIISLPKAFSVIIIAIAFLFLITAIYIFPVLARFENTIRNTLKNAFFMSILNLPRTILMIVLYALPFVIMLTTPVLMPVVFLGGLSLPVYLASYMFVKIFRKFEPQEEVVEENEITGEQSDTEVQE